MHNAAFPRILLILALLFTQLGGLTHGISHALAHQPESSGQPGSAHTQRSDQSLPHDKHCDLCAAYAQIGSAIGSGHISFTESKNCEAPHLGASGNDLSGSFVAFAARAPPYSA